MERKKGLFENIKRFGIRRLAMIALASLVMTGCEQQVLSPPSILGSQCALSGNKTETYSLEMKPGTSFRFGGNVIKKSADGTVIFDPTGGNRGFVLQTEDPTPLVTAEGIITVTASPSGTEGVSALRFERGCPQQ